MGRQDKYDDYYEEGNGNHSLLYMTLGVSLFILAVFLVVLAVNKQNSPRRKPVNNTQVAQEQAEVTVEAKPRADDLDIWNMYPKNKKEVTPEVTEAVEEESEEELTPEEEQALIDDKMNDGKHTKLILRDGSTEWISLSNRLALNKYDWTNLVANDNQYKYYSNGKLVSFLGVDIDRTQGEVDFARLKSEGIDFCMLRVGIRGYKTGVIQLDEDFRDNLIKATEAGLDVGVYFSSQAITEIEGVEEAQAVIDAIGDVKILYPVAIAMEQVDNDTARSEILKVGDRTKVVLAFLNKIKSAGFKPMIYGDKTWLLKDIELASFATSTVWLNDNSETPDYPYVFDMWQYADGVAIPGVNGTVNMNICFKDYRAQ